METFSALLALCEGNSPVTGEFISQRTVTWSLLRPQCTHIVRNKYPSHWLQFWMSPSWTRCVQNISWNILTVFAFLLLYFVIFIRWFSILRTLFWVTELSHGQIVGLFHGRAAYLKNMDKSISNESPITVYVFPPGRNGHHSTDNNFKRIFVDKTFCID